MNKYQELVENVEKTVKILNGLKMRVNRDFATRLSQSWGCEKDCISVEFKSLQYSNKNKLLTWNFTLVVNIITPDATPSFSLPGFSLMAFKDSEMTSPVSIKFNGTRHKLNEPIEVISDAIFQEIQKRIEQEFSWY